MPLLQGSRRGRPAASERPRARQEPSAELPAVQPRAFPLDADARSALRDLAANHQSRQYKHHIKRSMGLLKDSVGDVNVLLVDLKGEAEKRGPADLRIRERVQKMEREVEDLTRRTEEGTRHLIDMNAEMEDEKTAFLELAEMTSHEQPRPEPQRVAPKPIAAKKRRSTANELVEDDAEIDEVDDGQDPGELREPFQGVCALLQRSRQAKAEEYQRMDAFARYALNNDYTAFKRDWHLGMFPDGDPPVPDKSDWFDERGRPKVGVEAGDDDLAITGAVLDPNCPLSMTIMTEPYGSSACPHVFQKEAIQEFLHMKGGAATCPVPGCDETLVATELALDENMLRRLKRAQGAAARRALDESDEAQDEDDAVE